MEKTIRGLNVCSFSLASSARQKTFCAGELNARGVLSSSPELPKATLGIRREIMHNPNGVVSKDRICLNPVGVG
jgi:hypothetical protein